MKQALVEEARWKVHRYGHATPEEFDASRPRGESWLGVGRNHGVWEEDGKQRGIQREEREEGHIEIDESNTDFLDAAVVGRKISGVYREPSSGEAWGHHENTVTITLDDGAQLVFDGIGYDASSLITEYVPAVPGKD